MPPLLIFWVFSLVLGRGCVKQCTDGKSVQTQVFFIFFFFCHSSSLKARGFFFAVRLSFSLGPTTVPFASSVKNKTTYEKSKQQHVVVLAATYKKKTDRFPFVCCVVYVYSVSETSKSCMYLIFLKAHGATAALFP